MGRPKNMIIQDATDDYINNLNLANPPEPEVIEMELLDAIETAIGAENALRAKGAKLKVPTELTPNQIARLINTLYPIATISCAGINADPKYDLLAMYMENGDDAGTYSTSEIEISKIAKRFNHNLSIKGFDEVLWELRLIVPRKQRCMDKNLIAVNNGIFDYSTKELKPFSADKVFMTKSHVNYNDQAKNVIIHNDQDGTDWDVESWMNELSDDPEIVELLWQILSAIIRPNVRWNKSAWLYSESGNNGKGTLCELMRSLCGDTAYAAIPIANFGKDFALEPLTRATAIIVDENDVGLFIDKAANLKAVITNDVVSINRKFQTPISYQFFGFMVQCLNEFPRIKDKSDSFYRRQLFIPFTKCFTGAERKYIKNDYLHRKDVLEYVMFKVLNTDFYELSEPQACIDILSEYKEFNDPVRQFWEEMSQNFAWDVIPFTFLYDLYRAWVKKYNPNSMVPGKIKFVSEILNVISKDPVWYCTDKNKRIRVGHKMDEPELLISAYGLDDWKNPNYNGRDDSKICRPNIPDFTRGILRASITPNLDDEDGEEVVVDEDND